MKGELLLCCELCVMCAHTRAHARTRTHVEYAVDCENLSLSRVKWMYIVQVLRTSYLYVHVHRNLYLVLCIHRCTSTSYNMNRCMQINIQVAYTTPVVRKSIALPCCTCVHSTHTHIHVRCTMYLYMQIAVYSSPTLYMLDVALPRGRYIVHRYVGTALRDSCLHPSTMQACHASWAPRPTYQTQRHRAGCGLAATDGDTLCCCSSLEGHTR